MAAIFPSGQHFAWLMVSAHPTNALRVVEFGAGTGVITDALIRHGITPKELLAVEMDVVLHGILVKRFPRLLVAKADARDLRELIFEEATFDDGQVDAVLSSLGLLTMSSELQHEILAASFEILRPEGVFIQYTYGPNSPLHEQVCKQLGLNYSVRGLAWRSIPPASVFVYSKAKCS